MPRIKAMFTLEAAVIFSIITVFVVGVINLDFVLHDRMLSDVSLILASQRYRQVKLFNYDTENESIDIKKIIASPVIGTDTKLEESAYQKITSDKICYYNAGRLGKVNKISDTPIEDVLTYNDNAGIVRAGGRIVNLIGGQSDGN